MRLEEGGVAKRVVIASLPFALGFTVVFVVLGAGAAAVGGALSHDRQSEVAGLVLVVLGLAFAGLLPWPERLVAPGAVTRARASGSRVLLGGAFAVCAAPCVGITLARDPRARSRLQDRRPRRRPAGGVLARDHGRVRADRNRVHARDDRLPLGARSLRVDPDRERPHPRRAGAAALLPPRLVAERLLHRMLEAVGLGQL